jgi:NAD(P)-dependent dehydrogenase (short-subunit alcohol dehydrogenase family)
LATATRFAEGRAFVTIADIQDAAGQNVVTDLTARGFNVSFVHCDVTDWASSDSAFRHAAAFGPRKTLDVAVLNAGVGGDKGSIVEQVLAAPEPSFGTGLVPERPSRKGALIMYGGVYDNCWLALHYMRLPAMSGSNEVQKSLIITGSLAVRLSSKLSR